MISSIMLGAAVVGGSGLFIGAFLSYAGRIFEVAVDEKEEAINGVLPGNNCGGCGYAGCSGLAAAIAAGTAEANACPVGRAEAAQQIAEIIGKTVAVSEPEAAFVKCAGTCDKVNSEYTYTGIEDCVMSGFVPNGGPKTCNYGCLGFGNCVRACPFDAIHISDGIAQVDPNKCKACSKCVAACPKQLIELVPVSQQQRVLCSSKDKGKDVMKACAAGCIGCKMCARVCEYDAIIIEDNIAHIDAQRCTGCGKCAEKCPKKIIS